MQTILRRKRRRLRRAAASSFDEVHSRIWTSSVAAEALNQLRTGVIVTDSGAGVVEINRAAESIVQLEDGLLIRDDRLCARRAFESGKIIKLIAGATVEGKSAGAAARMLIGRCDGLPAYVLSVAPLRTGLAVDKRRFAMVVVVDPARHSPSEKDLAELFGLRPAEARLAAALLTGKTLADIAAIYDIRITTLRTQLGSVLRKAGAERQSDLIRILSNTGLGLVSWAAGWIDAVLEALKVPLSLAGV
jgi:DNA-binding CsgD family transcriptional regulator